MLVQKVIQEPTNKNVIDTITLNYNDRFIRRKKLLSDNKLEFLVNLPQTISVNNPLRYKNIDFYQSDWNLLGIRIKDITTDTIYELPLFTLKNSTKSWVTWVFDENSTIKTLIFDQLQNHLTVYDENGKFVNNLLLDDKLNKNLIIVDIIPATGLQIKYDPSIALIYFGFVLLMLTAFLSYLPYTQIWMVTENQTTWIGSNTNRGKIKLEIEFENLIRSIEEKLSKSPFILKS